MNRIVADEEAFERLVDLFKQAHGRAPASDCEAYRDVITDGETGFLVRDDHQWLKRMSELAADEGLREKMGAAAREAAQAWTIEGNWQKWAEAYTTLFPVR